MTTQQAAFDAPRMNLDPKTLLQQAHQFYCPHGRLFLARRDQEGQQLVGQLVRLLGPRLWGIRPASPASWKADSA